jgi:hypothetical protein
LTVHPSRLSNAVNSVKRETYFNSFGLPMSANEGLSVRVSLKRTITTGSFLVVELESINLSVGLSASPKTEAVNTDWQNRGDPVAQAFSGPEPLRP